MAQITSGKVKVRCSKFECREEDIHVCKCISSRHSNLLHLTLTFILLTTSVNAKQWRSQDFSEGESIVTIQF